MTRPDAFQKRFDPKSGQYYHVLKGTEECIWDVPYGLYIPLEGLSKEARINHEIEEQQFFTKREKSRHDRLELAEKLKQASQKIRQKELLLKEATENTRLDNIWRCACERGKASGGVRISSQKLGYVSSRLYTFEQDYGRKLTHLWIVDNELKTWGEIPHRCRHLRQLTLASNRIKRLEEGLDKMENLTHLNLLHNQLEMLPPSIGTLKNLRSLDVAGNCLIDLPPSIGDLANLENLNLECNRLQRLPDTLCKMMCKTLNLNSNELTALPRCISSMAVLRRLAVNDNQLKHLPSEIGYCQRLEVIHASKNCLMELPASLGRIASLECLWLDSNRLSALPANFHMLKKLRELKMEGNRDMVLPTVDVLARGVRDVLRWSECRFAASENSRKQNIVLSVQDVLKQVAKYKIGSQDMSQPHDSLFENNVEIKGEFYYQFLPEAFWNVFLPELEEVWWTQDRKSGGISSFPYERHEVERAMTDFRDAAGRVVQQNRRALFRQCSCKSNSERKKVCVALKGGWVCQRPALLLKKSVALERDMTETRRRQVEKCRIDEAVRAAERAAKDYLSTDDGKLLIRQQAEARILEAAEKISDEALGNTQEQGNVRNTELSSGQMFSKKMRGVVARLSMDYSRELKDMEKVLVQEFVKKMASDRRALAEDTNQKTKTILRSWMGLSMEDVFLEWKVVVEREKKQHRRDDSARKKAEAQKCQSEHAKLQYRYAERQERRAQPQVPLHLAAAEINTPGTSSDEEADSSSSDSFDLKVPESDGQRARAAAQGYCGAEREEFLAANRIMQCWKEMLVEKRAGKQLRPGETHF